MPIKRAVLTAVAAFFVVATMEAKANMLRGEEPSGGMAYTETKQSKKPKAEKKRLPQRYKLWIRIGRCEQPGSQRPGKINWSHPGPRYGGGLGIYVGTWQAFRVKGMPSHAGAASWRQQMWVANRIFNRYGGSHPWGCG